MFSKQFALIVFAMMIANSRARIHRITSGSSCHCKYRIQKERDDAVKNHNEIANKFDELKEFITLNNCKSGHEFNYDNSLTNKMSIKCDKCEKNYYRTSVNTTCLHCPEGFSSKEGSSVCSKGDKTQLEDTKYCPKGSIIGNDPYAIYGNSCIKCDIQKKEYMPEENIADKCLICESGSIIRNNKCMKCPIGYYEKNNRCLECDAGTYNDVEGSFECKKCENTKSLSYYSIGGNTCDDSYLFEVSNKVNEMVDMKKISEPVLYSLQLTSGIIYSNRKMIAEISSKISVVTGIVVSTYIMFASP